MPGTPGAHRARSATLLPQVAVDMMHDAPQTCRAIGTRSRRTSAHALWHYPCGHLVRCRQAKPPASDGVNRQEKTVPHAAELFVPAPI